jgi:molybdopterin biosynthesis enzyme
VVPIAEAAGAVLAEDVAAAQPVPARALALRSGYAVSSADLVGVSAYAPAGMAEPPPWVVAGDPLPLGTDAVLPGDAVARTGAFVEIMLDTAPGENARRAGEDLQAGEVLRLAGQVLRPVDVTLAQAAGLQHASIRPFTLHLRGRQDLPWLGSIAALIGSGIQADVALGGGESERGLAPSPASSADLVIVVGLPPSAALGRDPELELAPGVALRGAETTLVMRAGDTPVLVAPPRLDAVLALVYGLIRPLAAALTRREPERPWRRGRLTRKIASPIGLTDLALVRETTGGLEPVGAGAITLSALARAEGFFVLPPESEGLPAGAEVEAYEL